MIAGIHSGCGKSTAMLALLQLLTARGIRVAPFKAGPDFLDPMWHQAACGRESINLDTRMMREEHCRALFDAHCADADIALVEGVMGLFDGADGVGGPGSSAHLASLLELPVILVVPVRGMSGSIAPLVAGFTARAERARIRIAGILANHAGSAHHARMLGDLLEREGLPPLIGWIGKEGPQLPERHLGLVTPGECGGVPPDLAVALHLAGPWSEALASPLPRRGPVPTDPLRGAAGMLEGTTIAVARDVAFCFLYPANLAWLRSAGATLRFFSPLAGDRLPPDADAVWLPGGYPELHAGRLADAPCWPSLRAFIASGRPVLAECGGMMVLGNAIVTAEGRRLPMAGILPCTFRMHRRLVALGYREEAGGMRGHEFHHSERHCSTPLPPCFDLPRGDRGIRHGGVRASYVHWYFPSAPEAAAAWFSGGGRAASQAAVVRGGGDRTNRKPIQTGNRCAGRAA
ncbi:MAG: cobyrinate a,c-diamide synthase [Zetaproteobacteria bacterium]|nr:MAG: cobyrinate a,c-diamide synthase [Zetaproteobacteria bacterium]